MPLRRLHLIVDDDLGPALWVREQTAPGRSRPLSDLAGLLDASPPALAAALESHDGPLRHRVRIRGNSGNTLRVPALPLSGAELLDLLEAVRELVRERRGDQVTEILSDARDRGAALQLTEDLVAMPDILDAVVLDGRATSLVVGRRTAVRLSERFGQAWARWGALDAQEPAILHALVDARARAAFAEHLAGVGDHGAQRPEDPHDLLPALTDPDVAVRAELPTQRSIQNALDAYIASGRARVQLQSTDNELVVRLHEPPLGAAWPLQTCLREPDGTVHPVAQLRDVGDVTAQGAAEASAEVLRLAPTIRDATVDDTGVDWLLTTSQASAFLTYDTPALEAAGVTVLLPREWTKQKARLRADVTDGEQTGEQNGKKTGPKPGTGLGMSAMAEFHWSVAVGDLELTEEEIAEIREAQQELVHLRGQWIRLDQTTMRAAERFLDTFATRGLAAAKWGAGPGTPESAAPPPSPPPTTLTVDMDARADHGALPPGPVGRVDWGSVFALILDRRSPEVELRITEGASGPHLPSDPAGLRSAGPRNTMANLVPAGPGPLDLPPPSTLDATLRTYQRDGLNWMWALEQVGVGGILADDMGLGKTMQVLALLCREREVATGAVLETHPGWTPADAAGQQYPERIRPRPRPGATGRPGPTLLICPMSVVGSWQREAARFAPDLAVHVHHGGSRIRDESFAEGALDVDLLITTYSLLDRDLHLLEQVHWHRIVLDEAQHVKNPGTAVSTAARELMSTHRLALTGTPVENRLRDMYSLMDIVNPGLLGAPKVFHDNIAHPVEHEEDPTALFRLREVTAPFILRRVKTDRTIIDDLPEKIDLVRSVNLTAEQAGLYEALVDELQAEVKEADENRRRTLVISTLTKLKQVCNHPAHYLGDGSGILRDGEHRSGKLQFVDDLLETAFADGEKVLLFTQFATFGHMLVPYWRERFGMDVPFLHGGVSKPDRDAMVADFQAHPDEPGAMLLSLRAGGTGLTLTAANQVVHLDRWWNPAVENQATDRAFRIGQTKDVQVRKLVSAGTVEERIDAVLGNKQDLADRTIAPVESQIAGLDDGAIMRLLSYDDGSGPDGVDGDDLPDDEEGA